MTWTVVGPGSITPDGRYTAPAVAAGVAFVIASAGGKADTAVVRFAAPSVVARPLVGVWHVPLDSLARPTFPYTGGTRNADGNLAATLAAIPAGRGVALSIRRAVMQDASGRLSVARALADVLTWPDLTPALADGRVRCVIVGDDIAGADIWGGEEPPLARWDSIAWVVKQRWPSAPTCLRALATQMTGRATWRWLTHYWAQYHAARHGAVVAWRDGQLAAGVRVGLCPVFGLNDLNGGTGESGLVGTQDGQWQMSGAEVERYGRALLPWTPWLVGWQYGPAYRNTALPASRLASIQGWDARTAPSWWKLRQVADTLTPRSCP